MITRTASPSVLAGNPIRASDQKGCTRAVESLRRENEPSSLLARKGGGLGAVVFAGQLAQHRLEVLGLAEIAVDRGKPHIGDVVEAAQAFHHGLADRLRRDLA